MLLSIIQMVAWVSLAKVAVLRRSSRQPKSLFCKDVGWLQKRFLRTLYSGHVCRCSAVIAPAAHGHWSVLPILNFVDMTEELTRRNENLDRALGFSLKFRPAVVCCIKEAYNHIVTEGVAHTTIKALLVIVISCNA